MSWEKTAASNGWELPDGDALWTDGVNFVRSRFVVDKQASDFGRLVFRVSGAWADEDGFVRTVRGKNAVEAQASSLVVYADGPVNISEAKNACLDEMLARMERLIGIEKQMEGQPS